MSVMFGCRTVWEKCSDGILLYHMAGIIEKDLNLMI